jgi:hypothetical protein
MTCGSCHQANPTTGEHPAASNSPHSAYGCDRCHGAGFTLNTSVNKDSHVDGQINKITSIGWNATTRSCTNTCHGGATEGPW